MNDVPKCIDLEEAERQALLEQARFDDDETPPDEWPEPMPLVRPAGLPEPFPTEALGPVLENAALGIADITQCPPAVAPAQCWEWLASRRSRMSMWSTRPPAAACL